MPIFNTPMGYAPPSPAVVPPPPVNRAEEDRLTLEKMAAEEEMRRRFTGDMTPVAPRDVQLPMRPSPMMSAAPVAAAAQTAAAPPVSPLGGMADVRMADRPLNTGSTKPVGGAPAAPKSSIRALKMPNGKILFTNDVSAAGSEISTKQAGQEIRAQDHANVMGGPDEMGPPAIFPSTNQAMSGLLRKSVELESRRMAGERVPDGGLTILPETEETMDARMMEEGERELGLASMEQQIKMARMTPAQRAAQDNEKMQIFNMISPQIQAARARMTEAAQIPDPQLRQQAIQFEEDFINDLLASAGLRQPF